MKETALIAIALCVAAMVCAVSFTKWRDTNSIPIRVKIYNAYLEKNEAAALSAPDQWQKLQFEKAAMGSVYSVLGRLKADGTKIYEFHEKSGFPVKHAGLLYYSKGDPANDPIVTDRWKNLEPVALGWFKFND